MGDIVKGNYLLTDYPEIKNIEFPSKINISFAVCSKKCGNYSFIVDSSTHICEYCGHEMIVLKTKEYNYVEKNNS